MNFQYSKIEDELSSTIKRTDISHMRTKKEKSEFIRKYVNNEVSKFHISTLDSKCPVYELFSDGTVVYKKNKTSEKEEILFYEIVKPNDFFKFPTSHEKYEGITYGILSYEDCIETRKIMDDLLLQV